MPTVITGTDGVSQVQTGAVESGDLPAGSVIQVVQTAYSTNFSTSSGTFVDDGLSASITPTSASSKIAVFTYQFGRLFDTAGSPVAEIRLLRDTTELLLSKQGAENAGDQGTPIYLYTNSFSYLDSPATTSSITYKTQVRVTSALTVNINGAGGEDNTSTMILMEIAG